MGGLVSNLPTPAIGGAGRLGNHQPRMGWNEMGYEARETILYERRGRRERGWGGARKKRSRVQRRVDHPTERLIDKPREREGLTRQGREQMFDHGSIVR